MWRPHHLHEAREQKRGRLREAPPPGDQTRTPIRRRTIAELGRAGNGRRGVQPRRDPPLACRAGRIPTARIFPSSVSGLTCRPEHSSSFQRPWTPMRRARLQSAAPPWDRGRPSIPIPPQPAAPLPRPRGKRLCSSSGKMEKNARFPAADSRLKRRNQRTARAGRSGSSVAQRVVPNVCTLIARPA